MKPFGATRKDVTAAMARGEITFAVFGMGKMGMPLALSYAEAGGRIIGADVDASVVASINRGVNHIEGEPGLPELVPKHVQRGTLRATTDLVGAARAADVMVIIVPTLLRADRTPDLRVVESVARDIGKGLKPGDLVIQESTLPPGSTERVLRPLLEAESGLRAGIDFGIAFCPERTLSGRALSDIQGAYPKVVGGVDPRSTEAAAGIYEAVNRKGVIAVSSATVAEAVKVFEGLYRDVNIALANELALACEELGIDAREAIQVANTQPYSHIHEPGPGVGGHCIPVYPYFLTTTVRAPTPLLRTARAVNDHMPAHTVDLLQVALEARGRSIRDARVLVLGLTYRPGVRETRFSPALDILQLLHARGANARNYDALVRDAPGAIDAGAIGDVAWDGIVITLADAAFAALPWTRIASASPGAVVVDARRWRPADEWRAMGFHAVTIGAP